MKTTLMAIAFAGAVAAIGCTSTKDIQVEMVNAELVKIDTVYRQSSQEQQQLTWRDRNNVEYTSYVSMTQRYPIGMTMVVLRQR
jgi:uncharacterized protein YxeA